MYTHLNNNYVDAVYPVIDMEYKSKNNDFIVIIIEGLSLLQSILLTTANKQSLTQRSEVRTEEGATRNT